MQKVTDEVKISIGRTVADEKIAAHQTEAKLKKEMNLKSTDWICTGVTGTGTGVAGSR